MNPCDDASYANTIRAPPISWALRFRTAINFSRPERRPLTLSCSGASRFTAILFTKVFSCESQPTQITFITDMGRVLLSIVRNVAKLSFYNFRSETRPFFRLHSELLREGRTVQLRGSPPGTGGEAAPTAQLGWSLTQNSR